MSSRRDSSEDACRDEIDVREEVARRNRSEVLRRLFETGLVLVVGVVVYFGKDVRYSARAWNGGTYQSLILTGA